MIQGEKREYYAFDIIDGRQAVLYATSTEMLNEAIEEFLFYSGFIQQIRSEEGRLLYQAREKALWKVKLEDIQPSQLYISEEKYQRLLNWIQTEEDIIIPVTLFQGQLIALDGHTRLKIAQHLNFNQVTVYVEEADPYIQDFVMFCKQEQKMKIHDLPIISKESYQRLWNDFCKLYFKSRKSSVEEVL